MYINFLNFFRKLRGFKWFVFKFAILLQKKIFFHKNPEYFFHLRQKQGGRCWSGEEVVEREYVEKGGTCWKRMHIALSPWCYHGQNNDKDSLNFSIHWGRPSTDSHRDFVQKFKTNSRNLTNQFNIFNILILSKKNISLQISPRNFSKNN